jgi:dTDP-4-dehydrorhamnose reductase
VNAYGRSKLAGEQAAARQPRHLLLRTNIFGPSLTEGRESLSDFVLTNLRAHRAMTLFTDVQFTPLHLESLADLVVEGIDRELLGTFNAGSRDGRSKHDFGVLLANHLGLPDEPITPGRSTDVDGRAPRPLDLRLRVEAIEAALGRPMPTLADEIARL